MLGSRLKDLRQARNLSLRALAKETGLSATLLSQIERGMTEPSLGTLRKLGNLFGKSISALFEDPNASTEVWISRPGERIRLVAPHGGVTYERISRGNAQMEVLRAIFEVGQFSSDVPIQHPSVECTYVLHGVLTAQIGRQSYSIAAGESLSFNANIPHRYINLGTQVAEILMSITPPVP